MKWLKENWVLIVLLLVVVVAWAQFDSCNQAKYREQLNELQQQAQALAGERDDALVVEYDIVYNAMIAWRDEALDLRVTSRKLVTINKELRDLNEELTANLESQVVTASKVTLRNWGIGFFVGYSYIPTINSFEPSIGFGVYYRFDFGNIIKAILGGKKWDGN